jgi:iron(III) transport system ATP-binding protein
MIAGIETPTSGQIAIDGRVVSDAERHVQVPPEKRRLGMVFQSYAIWPHMTVRRNVEYPLRRSKLPRRERRRLAEEALDSVGLLTLIDRYPGEMSGGQQQRVALARAIVGRPALQLLDEPLSNLDARLRESMRLELKRLQVELGLTSVYVTHDQAEALALSDRVLVMDAGRVLQEATPEEIYRRPRSLTVARFLGVKNIVSGKVVEADEVELAGRQRLRGVVTYEPLAPGTPVDVAIRPDCLEAAPLTEDDVVCGEVVLVEFLGTSYEHQVACADGLSFVVHAPSPLGHRGDVVGLRLKPGFSIAFPAEA